MREQGRMRVVVTPGKVTDPNGRRITQPIPWGSKARLIMAHLSTEAQEQVATHRDGQQPHRLHA